MNQLFGSLERTHSKGLSSNPTNISHSNPISHSLDENQSLMYFMVVHLHTLKSLAFHFVLKYPLFITSHKIEHFHYVVNCININHEVFFTLMWKQHITETNITKPVERLSSTSFRYFKYFNNLSCHIILIILNVFTWLIAKLQLVSAWLWNVTNYF